MAKKKQNTKSKPDFKVGDLVGCKVKGHPLWPGRIEELDYTLNNKPKYKVRFFVTHQICHSFAELKHYKDCVGSFKSCNIKNKGLKKAIEAAQIEYESLLNPSAPTKDEDLSTNHSSVPSPLSIDSGVKDEGADEDKKVDVKLEIDEQKTRKVTKKAKKQKLEKKLKLKVKVKKEPDSTKHDKKDTPINEQQPKTTTKLQSTIPLPQSKDSSETTCPSKASLDQKNDHLIQPKTEPKSEGENAMMDKAAMQTTMAKLKEKVAKKIEEKLARKAEKKRQKLHDKVSTKLEMFNKKLLKFSEISHKLSIADSFEPGDTNEWKEAVRIIYSVLPALDRCINHFFDDTRLKMSNLTECRECHETLRKIWSNMKTIEKNNQVPSRIKKELTNCEKAIGKHQVIKKFIRADFENLKNAMIERKENDV